MPFTAFALLIVRGVALLVLGLAFAILPARLATADCLPLTPTLEHGNLIVPGVQGGVVYAALGAGRPAPLLMDLYVQPGTTSAPLVIVVHGGGWTTGSRVAHIGQLLELLTGAGYHWAAIDYRQRGLESWRESVDDVRAAVAFVRCHAERLQVDPGKIVLLGEDSGAQLAAHAAANGGAAAAVLLGGFYDLTTVADSIAGPTFSSASRTPNEKSTMSSEASLLGPEGPRFLLGAPLYVIHGGTDTDVPPRQAQAFCEGLNAQGGRCELDVVPGAIHRSENWWPSQWGYKERLVDWLARTVGRGAPTSGRPPADAGARNVGETDSRTYGPGLHKRIVYQPRSNLTLDAWIPAGAGPHVPVLLVHGGGWEAGDRVTYITPLFRPLADAGFAWFSMDYRLTPGVRHDAQLQDLRDAIAFLRTHASRFDVDPRKLVIVGESASGQMVSLVGIEDRVLAGVVSFYGVYDFQPFARNLTPRSAVTRLFGITSNDAEAAETMKKYSPLHRATKNQPPMLLVHGTAEGLWDQGRAFAERLSELGAPYELYAVEGAPHGIENWEGHARWELYKKRVVTWIREVTR
jgi:acetyl esterase